MIYTLHEISDKVRPIADKYSLQAVYVFGSYARGEASDTSDIDILVNLDGSKAIGLQYYGLIDEFSEAFGKSVDIIAENALNSPNNIRRNPHFKEHVLTDRKVVYERA